MTTVWVVWAECTKSRRSSDVFGKGLGALAPRPFFCYELGMVEVLGFKFQVSGFKQEFFPLFHEKPET